MNFLKHILTDIFNDANKNITNDGAKIRFQINNPELYASKSSKPVTRDNINEAIQEIENIVYNTIQSGANYTGNKTSVDVSIYGGYKGLLI